MVQKTSRREFLQTVAGGMAGIGAVSYLAGSAFGAPQQGGKPNIIVIMSDEHNAGIMGCAGNGLVQTPNLDKLAAGGVIFDAAYTNSPLCVPCRLSFTSGKYVSRVSAWNNNSWLPSADYPSLPRILKESGYEAFLIGKMHYDSSRRYGFTELADLGKNSGSKTGAGNRRAADNLKVKEGYTNRFEQFHPGDNSPVLKHDDKVTEVAADFLEKRKASDKPFLLQVGYLAPHFPLIVPEEFVKPYRDKVPMPKIPQGHLESLPLNYKHLRIGFHNENVPDEIVKKGRELYYGFVQWMDSEVGKLMASLNKSQVSENTIVIYTTDHGENMGEHGLWWKNCMYENASRVPLIFNWPKLWKGGQRRPGACSLVDVVQTIAELGGAKTPSDWDGDSLCQVLADPNAEWKDFALSEYYAHNIASGYVMVRMGKYKYVYHNPPDAQHSEERELYDLEKDPGEFSNLAALPEYRQQVEKMHQALLAELPEHPNETEARCRRENAKGYGRKKNSNKA